MESPVQCGCNAHAAPGFFLWQELPLKHPERAQDVRWTSVLRGLEWNGDAAVRCRRQRFMGIGEFPQQAENRFRVTKALLATFVRKQYPYPLHDDLLLLS